MHWTAFNNVPDGRRHWRRRLDHSVQNMDDSVVCRVVWSSHLRIVDEHAHVDGDGGCSLVQHGHHLSIGQVSAHDRTASDVVQQNVCQVRQRQKAVNVRSIGGRCSLKGCVSWSEQSQDCGIIQSTIQILLQQCSLEVVVDVTAFNNVPNRVGHRRWWQQHCVNDVHHSIVSRNVCYSHHRIVDEYTLFRNGHCDIRAQKGGNHLSIHQGRAQCLACNNVVGQNFSQVLEGQQIFSSDLECCNQCANRIIGGRKNSERTFSAQSTSEISGQDSGLEQLVVWAVHNHVHNRVGWQGVDSDGAHHACGRMAINAAVVVVSSWGIKGVRANADWLVRGHDSIERKVNRIPEGVLGDSIGNAIHVVISSHVEEGNTLTLLNCQCSRNKSEV